jgi:predicted double-glycine peptidase
MAPLEIQMHSAQRIRLEQRKDAPAGALRLRPFALGRRCGSTALLVSLLLALIGCQATQPRSLVLSEQAVSLDLPLVQQDEMYACGLASITTLCRYWGVEIPTEQRDELSRTAADEEGLSGDELCAALQRLGLETHLFQGALDHSATGLYRHVDAGRPPLVMLSRSGSNQHYCLVVGYDEPRGNLILLDPVRGRVLTTATTFARDWNLCQRFTLLACSKEATPALGEPQVLARSELPQPPRQD